MTHTIRSKYAVLFTVAVMLLMAVPAQGDEMLAIYGLKGYAYTYSPLVSDGLHVQAGAMYSLFHSGNLFHDENLECRDGYVWAAPVSLTYGDGNWWEVAAATHWEYWKNTDFDVNENGIGDLFAGAKVRVLGQDREMPFDLSLMPYVIFPTGDHENSIGDVYRYSAGDSDDYAYGINLLIGRRWDRFYLSGNVGLNYVDSDDVDDKDTLFLGLAAEYQVTESLNFYSEFINKEHQNTSIYPSGTPCYDEDSGDDIRELGIGMAWLKNKWGFKLHAGAGLTPTSPDVRGLILINRSF